MYNRVLNQKDLNLFKNQIVENDYSTKFPHIDLWGKDDAILKWLSVVNEFQDLNKSNLKVVDLGSGSGCVPHMISSLDNDVTAIDISNNPNITIEDIEKHPSKHWNWYLISINPNLTMKDIEKYPNKPWNWQGISSNPNITM